LDESFSGFGETGFHRFPADALGEYRNHGIYLREHNWNFAECYLCHAELSESPDPQVGRSCIGQNCHSGADVQYQACNTCHGDSAGASEVWLNWAPPSNLNGDWDSTLITIGAHQSHLSGSAEFAAVNCEECHVVPTWWGALTHLGAPPAEVIFSGKAILRNRTPAWIHADAACANTYCHGNHRPVWTELEGDWKKCGSCHAIPPLVDLEGDSIEEHRTPIPMTRLVCVLCHDDVIDATGEITQGELHVNGEVNVIPH